VKFFTHIFGRRNKLLIWVRLSHDVIIKGMSLLRFFAASMIFAGLALALPVPLLKHAPRQDYFLFVASNAKGGIELYRFNAAGPMIAGVGKAAELPGVVALAPHPGGRFLYAVTSSGAVSAFAIHRDTGALRLLNTVESTHKNACGLAIEKNGWMLLVSYCAHVGNDVGKNGGVESFRVAGDGGIGSSTGFQQQDGSGTVAITPDNLFLFAVGLDRIFQYRLDPSRTIFSPNTPPAAALKPGSHPIALSFRPDEKFAYSADESGASLSTFAYNREAGTLTLLDAISTAPVKPGAIAIDLAGRYLYLAGRAEDSITVLALDRKKGTPKSIGHVPSGGKSPSQLRVDPTGRFLFVVNTASNRIAAFQIDPKTGLITPASQSIDLPEPVALQFVPILAEGIH
jgi:6-phosphogluconolactonase